MNVRWVHPGHANCPNCGHEFDFLWDPVIPDLLTNAGKDGWLTIESFNGVELQVAAALRPVLNLTPTEMLDLVRKPCLQVKWPWDVRCSVHEMKDQLEALGVVCKIEWK